MILAASFTLRGHGMTVVVAVVVKAHISISRSTSKARENNPGDEVAMEGDRVKSSSIKRSPSLKGDLYSL